MAEHCDESTSGGAARIVTLVCRRALADDADWEAVERRAPGPALLLPCTTKIEAYHILQYLGDGADAVEIIACPDERCDQLDGGPRTERRVNYTRWLLAQVELPGERVGLDRGFGLTAEQVTALIEARAAAVAHLGPNPMKNVKKATVS